MQRNPTEELPPTVVANDDSEPIEATRCSVAAAERFTLGRAIRQAVVLAVIMFSSLACYLIVLKLRGHAASITTWTPWDDIIPFSYYWVWPYLLPYLIGPVVIGLLTRDTFAWFVKRGLVIVFVTLCIFVALPTQIDASRRTVIVDDGPTAELYRMMIEIDDPPANAAPSLHVSLTALLVFALLRDFPRWWLPSCLGVSVVWLSTLFTRQHHFIDVVTGVALAGLVVGVFAWVDERRKRAHGGR